METEATYCSVKNKPRLQNNPYNVILLVKAKQASTIKPYACVPQLLNYSILEKIWKDIQQTATSEQEGDEEHLSLFPSTWFEIFSKRMHLCMFQK